MPKLNETKMFLEFIKTKIINSRSVDTYWLEKVIRTNKIFTNFMAQQYENLKFVWYNINSSDNKEEIVEAYKAGNTIIFTLQRDVDNIRREIYQPASEVKTYTQSNLSRLTYESAKEKMAELDEYVIRVGKALQFDFHNNNIIIDLVVFEEEARTYRNKLDQILAYYPLFQELDQETKYAIVKGNILSQVGEELQLKKVQESINQAKTLISSGYARGLDRNIERTMTKIKEHQLIIQRELDELDRLRDDRLLRLINSDSKTLDRFVQFIERSPLLYDIEVGHYDNQVEFTIITKPLYIENYEQEKMKRALPHLMSDEKLEAYQKALIEGTAKVGIGAHKIILMVRNNKLDFALTNMSQYSNEHWRRYTCLGNFGNPIDEAKRGMDLFALINLLLQYIQTVNVGDPGGDNTLKERTYVVDHEGNILYGKYGETREEEIA